MKEQRPPLCTKIKTSRKTGKRIGCLQESFERFALHMIRCCPNNQERQQAIYRIQEACVWACRSNAMRDFVPDEITIVIEPEIIVEPTPEEIAEQEADQAAWLKANTIAVPENKPVVVVRKKKIPLSK